jgi:hypothetical protein
MDRHEVKVCHRGPHQRRRGIVGFQPGNQLAHEIRHSLRSWRRVGGNVPVARVCDIDRSTAPLAGGLPCRVAVPLELGVPMFFSSFDADENRRLLRAAGFELRRDDVVTMREPGGAATFLWVLATRAG